MNNPLPVLPALPETPDMSLRELRAELAAHGYDVDEIAALRNWTEAAELVGQLRTS